MELVVDQILELHGALHQPYLGTTGNVEITFIGTQELTIVVETPIIVGSGNGSAPGQGNGPNPCRYPSPPPPVRANAVHREDRFYHDQEDCTCHINS